MWFIGRKMADGQPLYCALIQYTCFKLTGTNKYTYLMSTLGIKSANDCGLAAAPLFDGLVSSASSSPSSSAPPAATPLVGAGGDSPDVYRQTHHIHFNYSIFGIGFVVQLA